MVENPTDVLVTADKQITPDVSPAFQHITELLTRNSIDIVSFLNQKGIRSLVYDPYQETGRTLIYDIQRYSSQPLNPSNFVYIDPQIQHDTDQFIQAALDLRTVKPVAFNPNKEDPKTQRPNLERYTEKSKFDFFILNGRTIHDHWRSLVLPALRGLNTKGGVIVLPNVSIDTIFHLPPRSDEHTRWITTEYRKRFEEDTAKYGFIWDISALIIQMDTDQKTNALKDLPSRMIRLSPSGLSFSPQYRYTN